MSTRPLFPQLHALIGDAAHSATPHLGQGAAMAVEDAIVLADELARSWQRQWPALPDAVMYLAASVTIISLLLTLASRLTDPVRKKISNADDTTLADHRLRCAALSGNMRDLTSIKAAFVAGGDAACYDVTIGSEDEGIDERSWATSFTFDLLAVFPA